MKNKKKITDPALKQRLTELEEIVERLGFKTRYEKGNFAGGYCVLKDSRYIVVNNRNEIEERITIVAKCIKEIGIDDLFIKPHLRDIIESESVKQSLPDSNDDGEEDVDNKEVEEESHRAES